MKQVTNLFLIVFFILAVIKSSNSQEMFTISGKVRYNDNNEIVTHGTVKCYSVNGTVEAIAHIEPTGDYILGVHRQLAGEKDLISFPGIDNEFDYIPTGYPNKIDPNQFVHIGLYGSLTDVDIYVERGPGALMRPGFNNISGLVLNDKNEPVKDAIVYIKNGENYLGFGATNAKGEYVVKNIPTGDFILVAHKVASESEYKNITVNGTSLENVVFNLTHKTGAENNTSPSNFSLSQNYPNPFNPSTSISYTLPKDGFVTLRVFNASGQMVSEIVSSNQNAGTYNVEFNAQNLSSGIYFYRLESNGFADTRKMILVK